ncbi:GntR family transcriptional regulator [Vagococcus coleopterorum]|uniref:GntR family transcriptional regulator n=1 Tax=Vagococcus coleopterorum TaxID=2714946 RepID=A0A6G8ANJ6_9ENTE|nr:GntR family transcriptional regulator [Vagococcus coleopterorum]QIL46654.1 GntR family transcriptional regulator [Vagococcus coleopterorum]
MTNKNIPIYIQIHDQIREEIEKGKWAVGDRLPSERELALAFNVSRMTLRQAVQTLADEGILERRIGSGTYVAREKVQERMTGTTSFSEIMLEQGKKPSSKTVSYFVTTPSSSEMEKLNLAADEPIVRMERIRYADGLPICFEVASIPARLVEEYPKKAITDSLYQTLTKDGQHSIGKAEQKVTAVVASERIAELLEIKKGEPILRVKQISFLSEGEAFEYVRSQYVGSRFEFFLER